jgi:hypothetical protein
MSIHARRLQDAVAIRFGTKSRCFSQAKCEFRAAPTSMKTRSSRLLCAVSCAAFLSLATSACGDYLDRWTERTNLPLNRVTYAQGMFVGVGPGGRILTSPDGKTWTARESHTTANLYGVAYGSLFSQPFGPGPVFVAVGDFVSAISPDGTNWSALPSPSRLRDVVFGAAQCVAVTAQSSTNEPNALSTQNGTNWTSHRFTTNAFGYPASFTSIAYGNGVFVAVADIFTGVWRYPDPMGWRLRTGFANEYLFGVAYGNGRFVTVGQEGPPLVSTNAGRNWEGFFVDPNNPSWMGNYFVGYGIAYGDGTFVIFRGRESIFTSTNGSDWVIRPVLTNDVRAGAFGKGTFVAVGSAGVFQSDSIAPNLIARQVSLSQPLEILFLAETGRSYRVEVSSNLTQWTEVLHLTNSQSGVQYLDWSITNSPQLFYRALTP